MAEWQMNMQAQTIVITGSTRGIGLGMAHEFLTRGHRVVISGRSEGSVQQALAALSAHHPADQMLGVPCDVSDYAQVQALWDAAAARYGHIDLWINNAAANVPVQAPVWEQSADTIASVTAINTLGVLYGCKVAISGMIKLGGGHVYNMEGFGSGGEVMPGNTIYGTSKAGLRYLTKALVAETKGTPVKVSYLSPGMVTTDLLMQTVALGKEAESERVFNLLADRVETVTPWLVDHMLANDKSGARIAWLTPPKIMARFMLSPFRKRDIVGDRMRTGTRAQA